MTTMITAPDRGQIGQEQADNGLSACICGCGRMVRNVRNRNGRVKEYYEAECRTRHNARAQRLGRQVLSIGLPMDRAMRAVSREALRPLRKVRQESVDLGPLPKQERLGLLCRAAERWGIIAQVR